jgi:hypothetical protein
MADKATAAQIQWLLKSPTNALCSSDRELKTVNIEKNTSVVNAIVCA